MIPRLLLLVAVFLLLFEGRMMTILLTHRVGSSHQSVQAGRNESSLGQAESAAASASVSGSAASGGGQTPSPSPDQGLAGLASLAAASTVSKGTGTGSQPSSQAAPSNPEAINSPAVVEEAAPPIDDSYFSDAVFIGDSRMEGFRNASGITQGTFLTGIGLSISDMDKQIIASSDGTISVYQGLSGRQYKKIYLMLGTNDLGFYPWDQFQPKFESVLKQFHELQPGAVIYVCSVIYVEESKIAAGYEYDNNENVQTINQHMLTTCEDLWYSYYVNLNEIFSDGNHQLISGASADGIHLQAEYCEQMLTYLKSHYVTDEAWEQVIRENGGIPASSQEGLSEAETEAAVSAG